METEKIGIAAEINAARNALLAIVLKKEPRRQRNVRRSGREKSGLIRPIPRVALLLGPQSADRSVMHSKRPGDIR